MPFGENNQHIPITMAIEKDSQYDYALKNDNLHANATLYVMVTFVKFQESLTVERPKSI